MRLLNFNQVTLLTALAAAFMLGYFVGDWGNEQASSNQAKAVEADVLVTKGNYSSKQEQSGITKQNTLIQLVQARDSNTPINAVPASTTPFAQNPQSQADGPLQNQSAGQLLGTIESWSLQHKPNEEIRDSPEFQQLLSLLAADPAVRKGLLERFMSVSGTPLGDTLSLALAMSVVGQETPEIKAAATQLLRSGTTEQRLNALQLLGQVSGNDPNTRSAVLDILRNDTGTNPKLALAAISSLSQKGVVSQGDYKDVVGSIVPFVHSQDPQVRQTSLQTLSQWAGRDPAALQTFTEATNDADPGVRALAVAALGQGGFTYESVRDTLISTLQNPSEDPNVIAAAQQALAGFPLDAQALAIYQTHAANSPNPQAGVGFN